MELSLVFPLLVVVGVRFVLFENVLFRGDHRMKYIYKSHSNKCVCFLDGILHDMID